MRTYQGLWIVWFLVLVGIGSAFGRDGTRNSLVVPLEVIVSDGRESRRAMIDARLDKATGQPAVFHAEALGPLLYGLVTPEMSEAVQSRQWLSAADLQSIGLSTEYSAHELSARVRVPVAAQPVNSISVRGTETVWGDPVRGPSRVSVALPFYLSAQRTDFAGEILQPETSLTAYGVELLPSLGLGQTVLASRLNYSLRNDELNLESWEAAVSRDFFETTRVTLGTARIDTVGFQTSQPIFGLGVERREGIGSVAVLEDRLQTGFEVETESVAEIFVNDQLIRTRRLAPGNYQLTDFPLLPGLNDVRVVITDLYGDSRVIRSRVSHAAGLLRRGAREFGLLGGVIGSELDMPLGRVYYRRGVLDGLTGEVYGEGGEASQMLGANLVGASRLGIKQLETAAVYRHNAPVNDETDIDPVQWAVRGGYQLRLPNRPFVPSLSLSALYRSEFFAAPGVDAELRRNRADPWVLTALLNQTLLPGSTMVVGSRYTIANAPAADRASAFAYLSAHMRPNVTARAGLDIEDITGLPEVSGRISVAIALGRATYRTTYHVTDDEIDLATTQRFGSRAASGSLGVSIDRIAPQEGTAQSVAANARASNQRGEIAVAARVSPGDALWENSPERSEGRVRLGSGLYLADGVFGVGRPATGSFAVVGKDRSLPPGPVLVNPGSSGAEARTGLLGGAVLSSLPDYSRKPIRIELPELPIDYAQDWSSLVLASGYRTGTGVRVGGGRLLYGNGRLLDERGNAVALHVFGVYDGSGAAVFTGFTDELGRFVLYDLVPGSYTIRLDQAGRSVQLTLSSAEELPLVIGDLVLSPGKGVE